MGGKLEVKAWPWLAVPLCASVSPPVSWWPMGAFGDLWPHPSPYLSWLTGASTKLLQGSPRFMATPLLPLQNHHCPLRLISLSPSSPSPSRRTLSATLSHPNLDLCCPVSWPGLAAHGPQASCRVAHLPLSLPRITMPYSPCPSSHLSRPALRGQGTGVGAEAPAPWCSARGQVRC